MIGQKLTICSLRTIFWCALWVSAAAVQAEPGLTANVVRLGVLMPLSNDMAEVGLAYMHGAKAAAEEVNRSGGIQGRKIALTPIDTLPVAAETVALAREALQETRPDEQVFALLGTVGQSSAAAIAPVLESVGVPLIGAATGLASQVRDGSNWMFAVRRGDEEVMKSLVKLLGVMSVNQIAVIHPRSLDAGKQVQMLQDASKGSRVSVVAQIDVGDMNIDLTQQVSALMAAKPEAVLSLGSYQMTEALVRQMRSAGYKGLFVAHSDVGTRRLMGTLKELSRGIGVASGLPSPYTGILQVAREFRVSMDRVGEVERNALDEASFEGYLAVRVFAEGFKRTGEFPTRRGLRQALASQTYEISGLLFDYRRTTDRGLQAPGSLYVMTGEGRVSH
jgi:ABC-type branched-subunit amino acid transport system substrate-binding protein